MDVITFELHNFTTRIINLHTMQHKHMVRKKERKKGPTTEQQANKLHKKKGGMGGAITPLKRRFNPLIKVSN